MTSTTTHGGWWTVEHAGAPRWLIAVAVAVFIACITSVAFNGFADNRSTATVPNGLSEPPAVAAPGATASPEPDPAGSASPGVVSESTSPVASASPSPTASATPPAPAAPPRVAFIGDSYTAGVGASSPAARWTSLLSGRLGWTELNFAVPGTGYVTSVSDDAVNVCGLDYCPNYEEVVPQVVGANPDAVVISGGRFDIDPAASRADRIADALRTSQAVNRTMQALETQLPDAELVVISPIWDYNLVDTPTERAHRQSVRAAATAAGATYIDIGEPLQGRSELVTYDGIYPSDAGHVAIADAIGAPALG